MNSNGPEAEAVTPGATSVGPDDEATKAMEKEDRAAKQRAESMEGYFKDASSSLGGVDELLLAKAEKENANRHHNLNHPEKDEEEDVEPLQTVALTRNAPRRPVGIALPGAHRHGGQEEDHQNNDDSLNIGHNSASHGMGMDVIEGAVLVSPSEELQVPEQQGGVNADISGDGQEQRELEGELIEGQIIPDTTTPNRATRRKHSHAKYIWCIVVLAILAGIALILGITLRQRGGSSSEEEETQPNPQHNNELFVPPFLEWLTPRAIESLGEVDSPAYMANRWLSMDPYLDSYPQSRQLQRFIMALVYYYSGGDYWLRNDGWLDYELSECDWYYQVSEEELMDWSPCDSNNNLIMLALASNNLTYNIPEILSYFQESPIPKLRAFDMANNAFDGVARILLGETPEYFIVSNNSLLETQIILMNGDMSTLQNIKFVKWDSNQIRFTFRGLVFPFMPALQEYNVTNNRCDGVIARQISYCRNLTYVGMGQNLITGTLPTELGLLTVLKELDVSGNADLGGSIPSELGVISTLNRLDVSRTNMTSTVPEELCERVRQGMLEIVANCSQVECCDANMSG